MNKKGFTLVELLATILILGLIGGIAVISYNAVVKDSRKTVFESYQKTMYAETLALLTKRVELIPSNGSSRTFYLSQEPILPIDPIKNPVNENDLCSGSYVVVTRNDYVVNNSNERVNNNSLTYEVCLICPDSDYNNCETYGN